MGTQFEKPHVYQTVSQMLQQAAKDEISVVVDRLFPLMAAAEAHAYAEGNARLRRVVLIP
jgi:NADPH:quinone reductase-like Zn-dependent oxidoreductase